MTVALPDPSVLYVRVFVSVLVWVLYSYDFLRVVDRWRDRRDRRGHKDGSTFRAVVKSFNLTLGLSLITISNVNAAFFSQNLILQEGLRGVTYVLLGSLLVGGLALGGSWMREDHRATWG